MTPFDSQPTASDSRRLRILLAEDNGFSRQVTIRILEKMGHSTVAVKNGQEAVAATEWGTFDLVLMDVHMPEVDGLEATAAIRERERTTGAHIPIVALTATLGQKVRERCLAAGMDAQIIKPIQPEELRGLIDALGSGSAATGGSSRTFNLEVVLARVDGDVEFLHEIVRLFMRQAPAKLSEIRTAIENRDSEALTRAAHTLKGSVSHFDAQRAYDAANRLEIMGQNGQLAEAEETWAALEREVNCLCHELADLIKDKEITQ